MSKIKDFLRNVQGWSFITVLYKRRLRVDSWKHVVNITNCYFTGTRLGRFAQFGSSWNKSFCQQPPDWCRFRIRLSPTVDWTQCLYHSHAKYGGPSFYYVSIFLAFFGPYPPTLSVNIIDTLSIHVNFPKKTDACPFFHFMIFKLAVRLPDERSF